jgi:hypothetical protein
MESFLKSSFIDEVANSPDKHGCSGGYGMDTKPPQMSILARSALGRRLLQA